MPSSLDNPKWQRLCVCVHACSTEGLNIQQQDLSQCTENFPTLQSYSRIHTENLSLQMDACWHNWWSTDSVRGISLMDHGTPSPENGMPGIGRALMWHGVCWYSIGQSSGVNTYYEASFKASHELKGKKPCTQRTVASELKTRNPRSSNLISCISEATNSTL